MRALFDTAMFVAIGWVGSWLIILAADRRSSRVSEPMAEPQSVVTVLPQPALERDPISVVAGGDEWDLAVDRFERFQRQCRSWACHPSQVQR